MTGDTLGPDEDTTALGAALRAEVPAESPTFWREVDDRFAAASVEGAVATSIDAGLTRAESTDRDRVGSSKAMWTIGLAAAALVIVGVLLGGRLVDSNDGSVETGFATQHEDGRATVLDPQNTNDNQLGGPVQNYDHWHSVYGVWDCTANGGSGDWVPAFDSERDESGIHSHGDGLIHIHPFFDWSAGENARLGLWADEMGIVIADDAITLDTGRELREGESCGEQGGDAAVVHLRRWVLDLQVLADPELPPTIVTSNLAAERFYNDREVWIIAYAPLDANIPLPPSERFDALINSSAVLDPADVPAVVAPGIRLGDTLPPTPAARFNLESSIKDQLQQIPAVVGSAQDASVAVPDADGYGQIVPLSEGPEALARLEVLLEQTNQEPAPGRTVIGDAITGEVQHFGAASSDGRTHELYLYPATTGTENRLMHCSALVDTSQPFGIPSVACSSSSAGLSWGAFFGLGSSPRWGYALLGGIDSASVWFRVELDDGRTLISNTADGVSFVAWGGEAEVTRASVLDVDLNEIWSQEG